MFVRKFIFSLFLIINYLSFGNPRKLPKYIDYCRRDDPNMLPCLKKAVEDLRPFLTKGIPEFQLPPLSRLVLPQADLTSGNNFKATFDNIQIFEAENFILNDIDINLNKNLFKLDVSFPNLRIKTHYQMSGKLLILTLNGQGFSEGNFTNIGGRLEVTGKRLMKNGKEYFKLNQNDFKNHVKFGKSVLKFDNIFGNNTELNEQTNKVINDNIDGIIEELSPVINKVISEFMISLIGRVFALFPISDLFPN